MVGHHPTNKLIGREPIPHRKHPKAQSFPHPPCSRHRISRISHTFMRLSRRRGQVTHVLLTRSPLIQNQQAGPFTVRLACVKHAASVRPEPGSNSPLKKQHPANPTHNQAKPTRHQKINKEPNHQQTPNTQSGAINQRKKQETNPKKDPFPKKQHPPKQHPTTKSRASPQQTLQKNWH